ncbi:MAG TPA: DMT family transporter [Anaerovoracaceae bacterium]|nr:DMT family transporter [Anaerovoracaceae bacterium]
MTKQMKADIMLLMVTLFWGVSYWLIDVSLTEVGPFALNALRFLIAFFIAVVFAFPKLKTVNKVTMKYSAVIGFALLFVYIGATFGVKYTSLSNAGFLCALTVVITPILAYFILKQKPEKKLAVVVVMCLIGIALLSLKENLRPALGDIFSIMAAFAYAVDLLLTEIAVNKEQVNAFQLGVFQLGFTGLFNLIISLFAEAPTLPHSPGTWAAVLFLSIFCTGLAFIAQALAQQYTSASHVGVIFSLEPVFAGFVAYFLAGEVLSGQAYIGAVLLVSGLFIMELDIKKLVTSFVRLNRIFVKNFRKN